MSVAVISPAIPNRTSTYLPELLASVKQQTVQPVVHIIAIDYQHQGTAAWTLNRALQGVPAGTEWVLTMADDDYLHDPTLIEAYLASATPSTGVVWSSPRVINDNGDEIPAAFGEQSPPGIHGGGAMIRHKLVEDGWPITVQEDRAMFERLVRDGVEFTKVDGPLWTYRMHQGSISQRGYSNGSR